MTSVCVPAANCHVTVMADGRQQLLPNSSMSLESEGHQFQILQFVLGDDQSALNGNYPMYAIGPLCQAVSAPSNQQQVAPSSMSQLMMEVTSRRMKNSSGKHRKMKKRRMNKELEMLGRSVIIKERRQQFMNETQWMPISQDGPLDSLEPERVDSRVDSPVPIIDDTSLYVDVITEQTNNTTPTPTEQQHFGTPKCTATTPLHRLPLAPTPVRARPNPLPVFPWADSREIWETMMAKEDLPGYTRDHRWFARHPAIQPRLRTVLLDWLMEVCEEYRLRRETYHVAVDFIDRYLSRTNSVSRRQLQLVGIGALFVAAKVEEIHPVKVSDISYVTGDTCTEQEILEQECAILKELKWDLTPITCASWVTVFLQTLSATKVGQRENTQFMTPQYSQFAFVQIMRLLDLCLLDAGSLQFPYSVLAASAIYHTSSIQDALSVSSYEWTDIAPCVQWMSTFAAVLRESGATPVKFFDRISSMETHTLQTHVIDSTTLATVHRRKSDRSSSSSSSSLSTPSSLISQPCPTKSARLTSIVSLLR